MRIDPNTFPDAILRYDSPSSNPLSPQTLSKPPLPNHASVHELNLANERIQLLSALAAEGQEAAQFRVVNVTPEVFASIIAETPATLISKPHTSSGHGTAITITIVAVVILLAGAAAAVFYRRRRAPSQVAA